MKIAIAGDHGGVALKSALEKHLDDRQIEYVDCGTYTEESCDYPDFAEKACRLVQEGKVTYAVLICGTGTVSYTHLRAHETPEHLVCRLLLEKKKKKK